VAKPEGKEKIHECRERGESRHSDSINGRSGGGGQSREQGVEGVKLDSTIREITIHQQACKILEECEHIELRWIDHMNWEGSDGLGNRVLEGTLVCAKGGVEKKGGQ